MGFLHKLWDETLAGPTPENGLGKLRNHISGENGNRKLMVNLRRVPDSPDRSSNPAGTPSETHATSLNACDWIVLNALDR
ncbi:dormancy-associated protein homolog 4 isoform X2 [Arabidopsis lyrata subsp. lyrata]|uniref:dormancy-associated protein homolog 4 isoform X2 n=1 Tax=Arabidopsis lyrata subsp. lyrata TaxID=81972 RepID=UPI000A29D18A|nr:dormancy-associated protein homolog 4 isoform X2 [Arabidopsis lyrata subsp. lyrata]|eukprot:XP_020888130.1 dormancy-associated protein homolog 4 isoform X2 [Arabidopsis lyrata subsp. lyrata]